MTHLHVFGDLPPKVMQSLLVIYDNRLNFLLQFLTASKLLVYKQLHFTAVPNAAGFSFSFVLFPDYGILSGNPKPNPLEALG